MLADDRFCGTDADRHEDISRNGSSGFGGSADSAEMGDLGRALIDARIAEQRARHAVRFPLRHILCNRLTCSLVCSCRNPSAVTFLYMCQTISFSKSSRDAPAALASLIAFFARSSSVGCEAKMRMREHDLANPFFKSPSSSLHSAPIFFGLLSPSNSNSQTTIKERLQHRKHFLDSSAHFLDVRAFNAIDDDGQIFHRSIVRCSWRLRSLQPILRIEMLEAVPLLPMHFDLAIEEHPAAI